MRTRSKTQPSKERKTGSSHHPLRMQKPLGRGRVRAMATGRPMARAMVFLAMLLVLPGVAQAQSGGSAPGGSAPGGASGAGVPTTRVPATRVPATGTSVVQDHGYLTLPARTSQDVLDQVTREAGRVQGVGRGSSSAASGQSKGTQISRGWKRRSKTEQRWR